MRGAVLPVRPKAMTVAVILAGLAPLIWSEGTGAEVTHHAAQMPSEATSPMAAGYEQLIGR